MVTKIYKGQKRRLYLVEWRDFLEVSAETLADRLDVTRQTVHRWERQPRRLNPEKLSQYAHALELEPEDLWRHPGRRSIDGMLANLPDDRVKDVTDMVAIWLKTGAGG